MAITTADYGAMKLAIAQLQDSLAQAEGIFTQAQGALDSVQAAWSSPHAAKKFYTVMQEWNDDHQRMTEMVSQLHVILNKVYTDLSTKEGQ